MRTREGVASARQRLFAVAILAYLLAPVPAWSEGFRILDHGAAAAGQGAAFAAQADDPSAIHYNPAGMTQLPGFQVMLGANLVASETTFTAIDGQKVQSGANGLLANPPPSHLYLTYGFGAPLKNLTVGVGLTSTFGLIIEYPTTGPLANVLTSASLPLLDIKPSAALQVVDWLSIGAGLDIYTFWSAVGDGHAEIKRIAGPESAAFGIPAGVALETNGTDTALGFNAGILVTPFRTASRTPGELGKPLLNIALVYRSPVTLDLSGDFLVAERRAAGADFRVELPWVLTGGVAGWPLRDEHREWKIEVDFDYVDWTRFENVDVRLSSGVTVPSPRQWDAGYVVMLGTEYRWLQVGALPGWEVAARGGYFHSWTPVPERTFDPAVPDADYNAFSIGLGLLCRSPGRFLGFIPCGRSAGQGLVSLDLAYQILLFDTRQISGNIDPRVNGRWETTIHVGALSLRVGF
jgi:long-chain fatty acid transport protein